MASKKSGKKGAAPSKSRAKNAAAPAAKTATQNAGSARKLPDKKLVVSLASEMNLTLKRSSELSGTFGASMRDAKERGVNLPAFRLAMRFIRKAKDDAIGGSILREDFDYYLECLEFEKLIASSMFPAAETRSGKKSAAKKNGKNGHETAAEPGQANLLPPPATTDQEWDDSAPVH